MVRSIFYGMAVIGRILRFWFRFFSGRPLFGGRKTDATFWTPATESLDPSGKALRWEMQRGAARAAWRMGGLYVLLLLAATFLLRGVSVFTELPPQLRPSFILLLHVAVLSVVGVSLLARRRMRDYGYSLPVLRREEAEDGTERLRLTSYVVEGRKAWLEEKVLPLVRSTSVILGHHIPERKATEWITVPKKYMEPGGPAVEIRLPSAFTGADEGVKKRLVSSVGHKLGIKGASASWQLEGVSPRVLISAPPTPPSSVTFSDVERFLLASEEFRPLLGLSGNGVALHAEMIDDSPHVGVSAAPGAGKSTLAKLVMMQALHWGWGIVVIDWKKTKAYRWLEGLPGVTYISDIEDIHDMGVRIGQEVDIRKNASMEGRANVLIVRDEWNVTSRLLNAFWANLRATSEPEERRVMPVRSPAQQGFEVLDFAGREFGMFDFVVTQRFSAAVFNGNADIRTCFGIRILGRYDDAMRKMLAPEIKPFPKNNPTPGRWVVVASGEAAVIQCPYIENDEARRFATSGKVNPSTPFAGPGLAPRANSRDVSPTQGTELGVGLTRLTEQLPVLEGSEAPLSVRKLTGMVESLEHLGITKSILQHAAKEDPNFPPVIGGSQFQGYTYDLYAVKEWAIRRKAARHVESEARK